MTKYLDHELFLFPPSDLDGISSAMSQLGPAFQLRPLHISDGHPDKKFAHVLSQLTTVGNEENFEIAFRRQFQVLQRAGASLVVVVTYDPALDPTKQKSHAAPIPHHLVGSDLSNSCPINTSEENHPQATSFERAAKFVASPTSRVIGTATLLLEDKFIHSCGRTGHIEDVAVDSEFRGKNLGALLVNALVHLGAKVGCYKILLDCSEKNVPFYEKCGFAKKEVQMVKYLPPKSNL